MAWISGVIAGAVIVSAGLLAAPGPANAFASPRPVIEPVYMILAAALAGAVTSYRLRPSFGRAFVLALAGAALAYAVTWWIGHFMSAGYFVRRGRISPAELIWRRDLAAAAFSVLASSSLSSLMGSR